MRAALQKYSLPVSAALIQTYVTVSKAFAQNSFAGPTPAIPGTPGEANEGQLRQIIIDLMLGVLNFLALVAVVVVIIAGIRLIVSQGEEDAREKAKKTIFYALAGLLVILFARVIVGIVTTYIQSRV